MKLRKVLSMITPVAVLSAVMVPLCSCASTSNVLSAATKAEVNTTWKEIYEIPNFSKWGSAVYQNCWVMNNSVAKRSTGGAIYADAFSGNKTIQHVAYEDDPKTGTSKSDIKTIDKGAFQGCSNLESAWIPGTEKTTNDTYTIGERAFFRCEKLKELDFTSYGTNSANLAAIEIKADAFKGMPESGTLIFDNTNCALFNTENGKSAGKIIEGGGYGEGKTFASETVMNNFTSFAKKCIAKGLNKNWFTKYGIKTSAPAKTDGVWNWSNIKEAVEDFELGNATIDDVADNLEYESAANMIGDKGTVEINGVDHEIRIIGTNHDLLTTQPSGKSEINAAITFEFVNLLSDSEGYPLQMRWDKSSGYNNRNYATGHLTAALNQDTSAETGSALPEAWTKYSSSTATAPTTSVREMLIAAGINPVQVRNKVNTRSSDTEDWKESNCDEYVFVNHALGMLGETNMSKWNSGKYWTTTPSGLSKTYEEFYKQEGNNQYQYYSNVLPLSDPYNWKSDTTKGATGLTGKDVVVKKSTGKGETAGTANVYWLRSPRVSSTDSAWVVYYNGNVSGNYVSLSFAVAPCFCI